ncbi:MAG: hypothetical protein ABIT36_12290 [Steroidobacteraceae bacterium]
MIRVSADQSSLSQIPLTSAAYRALDGSLIWRFDAADYFCAGLIFRHAHPQDGAVRFDPHGERRPHQPAAREPWMAGIYIPVQPDVALGAIVDDHPLHLRWIAGSARMNIRPVLLMLARSSAEDECNSSG